MTSLTIHMGGTARPWALPVTTATYTVSVDNTGATDVTTALNAWLSGTVPDGSIVSFPAGTYKISAPIDLRGRNHLIFEGNGSTLNHVGVGLGSVGAAVAFFRTQDPDYSGSVSTHITIRNFVATGANPTPGYFGAGEHAAVLSAYSGSYYEVDNVTASGLYGDLATFNAAASYAYVHDNHVIDCGRNGVSVVWGSHLLIEDNAFDVCGWSIFDVEPESASNGSTFEDIIYRRNTAGYWNSANGFFFGCQNGSATTVVVKDVYVYDNTVTAKEISTFIGDPTSTRRQNIRVYGNTGAGTAHPLWGGQTGIILFTHTDTVYAYGNTQTVGAGHDLYQFDDCTDVHTS